MDVVPAELPTAGDRVAPVGEGAGEPLRESGRVPPEAPGVVVAADLVCVLQDPANPVARVQTPAKVTDALAMGVPVLATPTPPLAGLARRGLIDLVSDRPLAGQLEELLENAQDAREGALARRQAFLDEFSYAAVLPKLSRTVGELLDTPPTYSHALDQLVRFCRAEVARTS